MREQKGTVYLIGAGPGDPGLLTRRGAEILRQADVIIYDYLVNKILLELAPPAAVKIYAGKSSGAHTLPQEEINSLLISRAKEGLCVVRLKGGDPFLFGRGGEEAEALREAGVPFVIVPGVTSAIAVPAYAGIPVTHRDFASSFAVVTGHESPSKDDPTLDWNSIPAGVDTLVLLMGIGSLPKITTRLIAAGRSADTPVAVIRWGTRPMQQTVTGTLEDIAARVEAAGLKSPAVIVVGNVVRLRDKLRWYDQSPLSGKRIVVTRSRDQASTLSAQLVELGAEPLELPLIKIVPRPDLSPFDTLFSRLPSGSWLILTSANGVDILFAHLLASGRDARTFGGIRIAVSGQATAEALLRYGIRADLIPTEFVAEGVAKDLIARGIYGQHILYARASGAREALPSLLTEAGAQVETVDLYDTIPEENLGSEVLTSLQDGEVEAITFTSASTVLNFCNRLRSKGLDPVQLLSNVIVASIGPITTEAALKNNLRVDLTASTHTIPGLIEALLKYYS